MLSFPEISHIAFSIGPLDVRWYGLMYLFGFIAAWILGRYRLKKTNCLSRDQFEVAITYAMLGVILGARLGYILFYDFQSYMHNPLNILKLWEGGMSFHGGLLGVLISLWFSAKQFNKNFFELVDFVAPLVPLGLFFGRIGNFINAELWGKATDLPWGMVFPGAGPWPRHPSQLYEAFLEGLVLFIIVWVFSSKKRPVKAVSGVFALGYGAFRFFVEFFREPDAHIGYLAGDFFTMGMLLCLPLILVGVLLLWLAYRNTDKTAKN